MSIAENPQVFPALTYGAENGATTLEHPPIEQDTTVDTYNLYDPQPIDREPGVHRAETKQHLGRAALKGLLFGPFRQMKDIGGEVKQAHKDYKSVKELVNETETESQAKHKRSFMAMKLWYAAPLPGYQIADDTLTYPLYLQAQEQFNSGTAYGVAAGATLGLASSMGFVQRYFEKKKADMIGVETVEDDSDNIPMLLDSSVNSAPWQVVRKANEPREEEGEPIKLVRKARIAQYAGAYAVVNTALYTAAEKLPVNEWVGFGGMLWGVWAVSGAYREVKEQRQLSTPEKEPVHE